MTEIGIVKNIDGDLAEVEFKRRGKCDKCRECTIADNGLTCSCKIKNTLSAEVGDYISTSLNTKKRVGSVLLYLIPVVLVSLCVGLGTLRGWETSLILGILGFVVGLAFAVPIDVCVLRRDNGYKPKMLKIASEDEYLRQFEQSQVAKNRKSK